MHSEFAAHYLYILQHLQQFILFLQHNFTIFQRIPKLQEQDAATWWETEERMQQLLRKVGYPDLFAICQSASRPFIDRTSWIRKNRKNLKWSRLLWSASWEARLRIFIFDLWQAARICYEKGFLSHEAQHNYFMSGKKLWPAFSQSSRPLGTCHSVCD